MSRAGHSTASEPGVNARYLAPGAVIHVRLDSRYCKEVTQCATYRRCTPSRYACEMRPLRYSINVTLDGCCDHRAIPADEDVHRHAVENLNQADALLFGRVTMQVFVREHCTMIAAPVQCDVDGIPKGSHYVRVPPSLGSRNLPFSSLIPGWMAQSAVVRDYRTLEIGQRRANRLELTVSR